MAAMGRRDEQARDGMRDVVNCFASDPVERILATFDYLRVWIFTHEFRG